MTAGDGVTDRPTYIDIDGTLTDDGKRGGKPIPSRIAFVQRLLASGTTVVIWSGSGTNYAREFVIDNKLTGAFPIGKPEIAVDDNPNIRPVETIRIRTPEEFFDE